MRYPLNNFRVDNISSIHGYLDVSLMYMGDVRNRTWMLIRSPEGDWWGERYEAHKGVSFIPHKLVSIFVTWMIMTGVVSQ